MASQVIHAAASDVKRRMPASRWLVPAAAICGTAIPVMAFSLAVLYYGSVAAVQSKIRGDRIYCPERDVHIVAKPGQVTLIHFKLLNVSNRMLRVGRAMSSCGCAVFEGDSIDLIPGRFADVSFRVEVPQDLVKPLSLRLSLFVDGQDDLFPLTATIQGANSTPGMHPPQATQL